MPNECARIFVGVGYIGALKHARSKSGVLPEHSNRHSFNLDNLDLLLKIPVLLPVLSCSHLRMQVVAVLLALAAAVNAHCQWI